MVASGEGHVPLLPPLGPALVWVIDKGIQSIKKIYSVVMKLK